MPKSRRLLVLSILIPLATYSLALGQKSESEGKKELPTQFPAGFTIDSPASIYKLLERHKKSFRKSEFETREEFANRIRNLIQKLYISRTKTVRDDLMVVSFDFDESYDADQQTYTVVLNLAEGFSLEDEFISLSEIVYGNDVAQRTTSKEPLIRSNDGAPIFNKFDTSRGIGTLWQTIELASGSRTLGTALGQNAFGVKRRYRIKTYTSLYLATQSKFGPNDFSFRVTPKEAQSIKGRLAAAITAKLCYPFISNDQSIEEATLSEPEESHYFKYYLLLDVTKIAIYDIRSGRIYKELDLRPKTRETSAPAKPLQAPVNESVSPTPTPVIFSDVKIISKPRPGYTDSARQANTQGTVLLNVTFLASGQIGSVVPVKSLPNGLTEQAMAAARRISFEPAKENGIPVTVSKIIDYPFSIY